VCNVSARLRGFPMTDTPFDAAKCRKLFVGALPALVMPAMILATPTEVSMAGQAKRSPTAMKEQWRLAYHHRLFHLPYGRRKAP
jgi:hypothetical protein